MLIRVGAPPKSAFNQDRPISDLIRSQVEHLKHVEERLTPEQRSMLPGDEIRTEAEAAKYIAAMTAVLQSGARAEQIAEVTPKVESIRTPRKKAGTNHAGKAPAGGRRLALAASASASTKKQGSGSKKKAASGTKKKVASGAKKKAANGSKKKAASARGSAAQKRPASGPKKAAKKTKSPASRMEKRTGGRATKKTGKKAETSGSRKKR